ncbi:MAG: hypothetical protein AAGI48_17510 [Verrucomicrobiota bacterium]
MNRNVTLIAAIVVLLVGVAAFAFLRPASEDSGNTTGDAGAAGSDSTEEAGGLKPTRSTPEREERDTGEEEIARLTEEYGESRTNLSRHIVGNVTSMLDDVLEMGEMMAEGRGFGGRGGNWAIRGMLRGTEIDLDDEQEEQINELYRDYQKRELERAKADVERLKENPSAMMGFVLASDARSREEISEEEYEALQLTTSEEFQNILNPLDRNNFRGGRPMEDEDFVQGFESVLTPDQLTEFTTAQADREPRPERTNFTEIPVMDLDTMDKSIESAKQMTTGFKSMMQGMGNLRELEEQRQGDEE